MQEAEIRHIDWAVVLCDIASEVTLVHRRNEFRGALDSVEKVQNLKNLNKINVITPAEVVGLTGHNNLESIIVENSDKSKTEIKTDFFIPLFGLSPKLGPIANWGLEIEKNAIKVNNSLDYQTNIPGIFCYWRCKYIPG